MDIAGIGGIAYQFIVDRIQKCATEAGERDHTQRYLRAITFELRLCSNLIDLAIRADKAGDSIGRNGILCQLECPILAAVAMGLSDVPVSEKGLGLILDGLSRGASETESDQQAYENHKEAERDIVDYISLCISRLYTTKALARAGNLAMDIEWEKRLRRLRNDLLEILRRLVNESSNKA